MNLQYGNINYYQVVVIAELYYIVYSVIIICCKIDQFSFHPLCCVYMYL